MEVRTIETECPALTTMQPYQGYLKTLKHNLAHGDSTEHTQRAALQTLLKAIAPDVDSLNEAQRIACGARDLSMRKGGVPISHIEAKDVGTNLDEVERGKDYTESSSFGTETVCQIRCLQITFASIGTLPGNFKRVRPWPYWRETTS